MFKILSTSLWSFLLLIAGIGWNAPETQAQSVTCSYIFDGQTLVGTSSQPGATANNATYGPGLSTQTFFAGNPGDAMAGDGFASGAPLVPSNNDYFGFSITAGPCSTVTITSFSFDGRRSGTGPANQELRSSADGFASTLLGTTLSGTNFESKSGALATLTIAAGQTLSFRLYGYNATGGTGTLRIDNVKFNGNITAAGPSAFTVTGGGPICPPAGASVGLTGSETGVNYQLLLNNSPIGSPVGGTGNALSLGVQTSFGVYTVLATNGNGCTKTQTGSVTISQSSNCGGGGCSVTLNTTQVNVLCNGNATGSIDLTPSNGAAPYTYDWSNDGAENPDNDPQDLINVGAGTYTVTVTDANSCTQITSVTITQPTAISLGTTQVNVPCNGSPTGSIDLTPGGGTPGYTYLWSNGSTTQDVSGLSAGTYTVTVSDASGCSKTISATITQPGALSLSASQANPSNCFLANGSIDLSVSAGATPYTYDWSNDGPESPDNDTQDLFNMQEGAYTVTVTDANGCSNTYSTVLDYIDIIAPAIACPANTSVPVGDNCSSLLGTYVPTSLSDNCTANPTVVQNPVGSTILNGQNPSRLVTLTATDEAGNTKTCAFTVSLSDLTKPNITCPADQTVNVSAGCTGTVGAWNPLSVNDNCSANPTVVQSPASSTVLNGNNDFRTVTLTATDNSGNSQSCTFNVTLKDVTKPTLNCPANVTLNADANCSSAIGSYLPTSLSDNCSANPTVTQSPVASTLLTGHNAVSVVTLIATDDAGNTQTCTLTVTLKDVTPPSLVCKNYTADLDASGSVNIVSENVYQSGADNCGTVTLKPVVPNAFTCNHVGSNLVTLGAFDGNGNTAICVATVTVRDVTSPVAKCKDATIQLGVSGIATVATSAVNNGTSDNCSFTLNLTPGTFNCTNVGINTVTLQATDAGGNTSTCTAQVTVKDVVGPTAKCKNPTIFLDELGHATLSVAEVNNGSSDACGISSMSINKTEFNCSELPGSSWPVTLNLTDMNGNVSSCLANVTVKDAIAPTPVCENVTVRLGASGKVTVYAADLAYNSFDNCSVWSYTPSAKVYTTANLGANNLNITVKDWSGNGASCVSVVTVLPYGDNNFQQSLSGNKTPNKEGIDFPFAVYPNPTTGDITVTFELPVSQQVLLQIFDLQGRLVSSQEAPGAEGPNAFPLQLNGLTPGIYFVDFQSADVKAQKRFIVQE